MADMLGEASAWIETMRVAHISRAVTYQRGGDLIEVRATIGRKAYEVADEYGAVIQVDATDFIVAAVDLVLGGEVIEPQPGDRVRMMTATGVEVYEVLAPGPGMPHYEPADPYRGVWRIHTKHVASEEA